MTWKEPATGRKAFMPNGCAFEEMQEEVHRVIRQTDIGDREF